jgi:hypothetical protein
MNNLVIKNNSFVDSPIKSDQKEHDNAFIRALMLLKYVDDLYKRHCTRIINLSKKN